jgi:hypothetical protein
MGLVNNLSRITNQFLILKKQIKTSISGKTGLNQGVYGLYLRSSSKLSFLPKEGDQPFAVALVGCFLHRV